MRLADEDGFVLLRLLRLGTPGWVVVEVEASTGGRGWTAVHESLQQRDVRSLVRWLRQIAGGGTPGEEGFLEPNLRFVCLSNDDRARVRVWFELELRPDWAPSDAAGMDDLWIDLDLPREAVAAAADALAADLEALERR